MKNKIYKTQTMGNFNITSSKPFKLSNKNQIEITVTRTDEKPLTRKNVETINNGLKKKYDTNVILANILPYAGNWHTIKVPKNDLTWENEDDYYDEIVKQVKSDKKYVSQKEFNLHSDKIKEHASEIFASRFVVWYEGNKSMFKK